MVLRGRRVDPLAYESGAGAHNLFMHRGLSYWRNATEERLILGTVDGRLIALDPEDGQPIVSFGERVWHFQIVHHGVWDYDLPAAPNLVDIEVDGRSIQAVAQITKQGFVYVFDRVTGEPVWPIEERPVPQSTVPGEKTSPTQLHPRASASRVGFGGRIRSRAALLASHRARAHPNAGCYRRGQLDGSGSRPEHEYSLHPFPFEALPREGRSAGPG